MHLAHRISALPSSACHVGWVFMILLSASVAPGPADAIIYVDAGAGGANDGTSWVDAYVELQSGLSAASVGDTIWVAAGTYTPTSGADRTATFQLATGVVVYGGFAGGELSLSERDLTLNPTVLSGEIGLAGSADNSYHVVTGSGTDASAELDGFLITGGNADGVTPDDRGGGVLNVGGSPTLVNLEIYSNTAANGGGVANADGSSSLMVNVVVRKNSAVNGGGIYNATASNPSLVHVTIGDNDATVGGGMSNTSSSPSITNSIVAGNTGLISPEIHGGGGAFPVYSHSLIRGAGGSGSNWIIDFGIDNGGNIDVDPVFADTATGDLRPTIDSPTIDAGDSGALNVPQADLDGNPRLSGLDVDMGAYEYEIACPAGVLHVDAAATPGGDGSSWGQAYSELRHALRVARSCVGEQEIWVAAGTYVPSSIVDRNRSFVLRDSVRIYGGFDGTELSRSERDPVVNVTVLSGEIGAAGSADNSYHVVVGDGVGPTALLDGVTVTSGRADGAGPDAMGAGMRNDGGSPTVSGVRFTGNAATSLGGGMLNTNQSHPSILNSRFDGNTALSGGGAANTNGSHPVFTNVIIDGNVVTGSGGAMHNTTGSDPALTNLTIYGNTASTGGAITNVTSSPTIVNSILWGDTATTAFPEIQNASGSTPLIHHSLVAGSGAPGSWDPALGTDGGNNVDGDPVFADLATGDLRLMISSPAVNAGDNAAPNLATVDFDGNPRISGAAVDMGAYETLFVCPPGSVLFVKADAATLGDGSSWGNALRQVSAALGIAALCPSVTEIWVAGGIYVPTQTNDRVPTHALVNGVAVYGGFSGTETLREERDPRMNPSILSGEIGGAGNADNSYHVVTSNQCDASTVLDGFTIVNGNSAGAPVEAGGGIRIVDGNPTLRNLAFGINAATDGGAMACDNASPTLERVTFSVNTATRYGGAVYNHNGAAPRLTHVLFEANTSGHNGGAMYNTMSDPVIASALFLSNVGRFGGAICNNESNTRVVSATFYNNHGSSGGAIYNRYGAPEIENTIMWRNSATYLGQQMRNVLDTSPVVAFSLIEGSGGSAGWDPDVGTDGGGNVDADPLFVDVAVGNLRIRAASPAFEAGNSGAADMPATDLDGRPRVAGAAVDMGPYEFFCPIAASVLYVVEGAAPSGDGTSWGNALPGLADALRLAAVCSGLDTIWVAAGTYHPAFGTDRAETFLLRDGLAVFGGFAGTESSLAERDVASNVTVLSGEIGSAATSDNSHHVVTADGVDSTGVLDGFTITGGNAAMAPVDAGGGLYILGGNPVFRNLTVVGNAAVTGGGAYSSGGAPTLDTCVFQSNDASKGGGLANMDFSDVHVVNVAFRDNTASDGAGLYSQLSGGRVVNALFEGNLAINTGGAIHSSASNISVLNATLVNNTATTGGAMYNNASAPSIVNTIMWDNSASVSPSIHNEAGSNPAISYSLVDGSGGSASWNPTIGSDGGNNIDTDPMFVASPVDLRLDAASPAIDAGDSAAADIPPTDLDGNDRVSGTTIDMGAYEFVMPTGIDGPVVWFGEPAGLHSAFPNPFNPSITIRYVLEARGPVRLTIYDVRGRRVRALVNDVRAAGEHGTQWDGRDGRGEPVASGVYLLRLDADGRTDHRKITLLR